jgi:hypothetical protein
LPLVGKYGFTAAIRLISGEKAVNDMRACPYRHALGWQDRIPPDLAV